MYRLIQLRIGQGQDVEGVHFLSLVYSPRPLEPQEQFEILFGRNPVEVHPLD